MIPYMTLLQENYITNTITACGQHIIVDMTLLLLFPFFCVTLVPDTPTERVSFPLKDMKWEMLPAITARFPIFKLSEQLHANSH